MREELIELLRAIAHENCFGSIKKIVEYLIANGVTVQDSKVVEIDQFNKWIPVTERLPENKQTILAIRKDGSMFIGYYMTYIDTGRWHIWTARNSTKLITQIVTHWMPLPEPPNGISE